MNGRLIGLILGLAAMSAACESTPEAPPAVTLPKSGAVGDPYASLSESDIYVQLGVQYMEAGSYAVALQDLQRALEADSGNGEAHNALAVLYERINRLPDAEQHFQRALSLDADNYSARNNYGRYLCGRGRVAEGMEQIQRVIAEPLYRQPWVPLTNAGLCAVAAGQSGLAEDFFRRALERNPQFAPAVIELAKLGFATRRHAAARALLDRYHKIARATPESLWLAAQTELALGDREAAAEHIGQLQRRYPDSHEAGAAARVPIGH